MIVPTDLREGFSLLCDELTIILVAEVDEAVAAEAKQDGTGGRGANGFISSALAEEHKKDDVMRNAV